MTRHNILHVEDDPNDVLLVQRAFRKADVPVTLSAVHDGDAAISYLQANSGGEHPAPPALVLLDLKIPRKSGLEVLAWLRQEPSLKRIPVIILTSSKHDKDINHAYELGANSYLVKPVGFDALLDMVKMINSYWLHLNENPTM